MEREKEEGGRPPAEPRSNPPPLHPHRPDEPDPRAIVGRGKGSFWIVGFGPGPCNKQAVRLYG